MIKSNGIKTTLGELFVVEVPAEYHYELQTKDWDYEDLPKGKWTMLVSKETDKEKAHYKFAHSLGFVGDSPEIIGQSTVLMTDNIEEGAETKLIIIKTNT